MPGPRPGREDQKQARIAAGRDLMAFLRDPVSHESRAAALALTELDLAVDHDQIRMLMDLVLLELLAGGQEDRDGAGGAVIGAQDLRLVRLNVERADVPGVHGAESKPLRAQRVARLRSRPACPSGRARGSTRRLPARRC